MAEMTDSLSWRLTAPLRRIRAFGRDRRKPGPPSLESPPEQSVLGRRIG
jgi:hypothetical protein